jgi:hypothetical protein
MRGGGRAERKERHKIKLGRRKGRNKVIGFEVLIAVVMKSSVFWDITQSFLCQMLPRLFLALTLLRP